MMTRSTAVVVMGRYPLTKKEDERAILIWKGKTANGGLPLDDAEWIQILDDSGPVLGALRRSTSIDGAHHHGCPPSLLFGGSQRPRPGGAAANRQTKAWVGLLSEKRRMEVTSRTDNSTSDVRLLRVLLFRQEDTAVLMH